MSDLEGRACGMQVLDDSTDKGTRDLVDDKVLEWKERGVEIEVRRRTNRAGYKAGALHEVTLLRTWNLLLRPMIYRWLQESASILLPCSCLAL